MLSNVLFLDKENEIRPEKSVQPSKEKMNMVIPQPIKSTLKGAKRRVFDSVFRWLCLKCCQYFDYYRAYQAVLVINSWEDVPLLEHQLKTIVQDAIKLRDKVKT